MFLILLPRGIYDPSTFHATGSLTLLMINGSRLVTYGAYFDNQVIRTLLSIVFKSIFFPGFESIS